MALMHAGFFSNSLGMCVSCEVIVPQKAALSGAKLPVLWLLHGASDDHTIWQRRTSIERYAEPLGLAVVMPSAHLSGYCDMAHGGRYFTYIADELPRVMRDFFPFSQERAQNFVAGLSMGGFGAMQIGLARPEQYCAIGCLSAGLTQMDTSGPRNPAMAKRIQLVHGDEPIQGTYKDARAAAERIAAQGLPAPRIYHACGEADFLLPTARKTRDFFQSLAGNPFAYRYEECPGAHTWAFWDEHIQRFLAFLALPVMG